MSDIVEQLRKIGRFGESHGWGRDTIWFHAADEIEKLRAALLFMVKALEGYGEIDEEDHLALTAARAALGEKE